MVPRGQVLSFFFSFSLYIDKINRQVMHISAHMWLITGGVTICKDARRGLDSASLQAASGLVKLTRTGHEIIPTYLPSSSNVCVKDLVFTVLHEVNIDIRQDMIDIKWYGKIWQNRRRYGKIWKDMTIVIFNIWHQCERQRLSPPQWSDRHIDSRRPFRKIFLPRLCTTDTGVLVWFGSPLTTFLLFKIFLSPI